MTTSLLVKAALQLSGIGDDEQITQIEFEDVSGHKFNYTIGTGKPQFIDLGKAFLEDLDGVNKCQPEMKTYDIYHPAWGKMNHECKPLQYEYVKVATLKAANLRDAYRLAQNDFNEEYEKIGVRSTSVGDIIFVRSGIDEGFLIRGTSFEPLDFKTVRIDHQLNEA